MNQRFSKFLKTNAENQMQKNQPRILRLKVLERERLQRQMNAFTRNQKDHAKSGIADSIDAINKLDIYSMNQTDRIHYLNILNALTKR